MSPSNSDFVGVRHIEPHDVAAASLADVASKYLPKLSAFPSVTPTLNTAHFGPFSHSCTQPHSLLGQPAELRTSAEPVVPVMV